jgi:cytochrome P450
MPALPPGPPAPRGTLDSIWQQLPFLFDPVGVVAGRFHRYGDVYHVASKDGPGLYVFRHPAHLHDILVTHAKKIRKTHSGFRRLGLVLGDGLLTSDGERWRRRRRLVQPAFARKKLAAYGTVFGEEAARQAASWTDGQIVDVSVEMTEMTLRIVARSLFGRDEPEDARVVRECMAVIQNSLGTFDPLPAPLSPLRWRLDRATARLDRLLHEIMDARRGAGPDADDLCAQLLRASEDGEGLTDREVRDELITLFLAGHETTANGLTWALWLLDRHPEAWARLRGEALEVLGERPATWEDLPRLAYAAQAFKEALRLYPPVYVVGRQAAEAFEVGGYTVPAEAELVLWFFQTHRDPRFWEDPTAFRPERFDEDAEAAIPRGAYAPFGLGPRTCIGKGFALAEGTLTLATLAARARLAIPADHRADVRPRITLTPAGGMPARVEAR